MRSYSLPRLRNARALSAPKGDENFSAPARDRCSAAAFHGKRARRRILHADGHEPRFRQRLERILNSQTSDITGTISCSCCGASKNSSAQIAMQKTGV
jgi:hypothetical protein